mgnify:CR=1 FL=1
MTPAELTVGIRAVNAGGRSIERLGAAPQVVLLLLGYSLGIGIPFLVLALAGTLAVDLEPGSAPRAARPAAVGAVKTVTPVMEVRSRRVGGANYQVPVEVPPRRARTLAVRWLVTYSRDRREKQMADKLANEILDALNQQGGAFKRKDDLYRMAQANKAFAHYRW